MKKQTKSDICGAITFVGATEFICRRPPHKVLRLALPGDVIRDLKREQNTHYFERRYNH